MTSTALFELQLHTETDLAPLFILHCWFCFRISGENLSDCLSDDPITPDPEPTSISFTYHTISTLITPIPHTSHDTNDSLDDVLDAITAASGAVNKKNDDTPAIPKPFTISDSVESKAHAIDNKKSSLDKKAEFLMAMLEGNNSYMQPEEMRTVSPPKRSHSKRKTTETDQPNNHQSIGAEKKTHTKHNVKGVLHHNESNGTSATLYVPVHEPRKHSVKRLEAKPTDHKTTSLKENKENEPAAPARADKSILQQITNSPEKPKRDLNAYESKGKMNNLLSPDTAEENNKPLPRVRHLSQENLMSNKILTAKSNDTIDLMRIKSMQKINDTDTDNLDDNRFEKILKKYTSQQSFFTKDLLSQIADRVYGFEDPFDTTGACDDGSSKCTPNSKLTTRKISVHRKESAITPPILENDHEVVCVKSGPKKIEANSVSSSETLANRRPSNIAENGHDGLHKNGEVARETKHFLSIERDHSIVRERIEPKTIEQTAASPEEVKHEIHETKPIDLSVAFDSGIDDILNVSTISDQLDDIAEPSKTCDKSENANSSDEENTDSDITVKEIPQIELTETISDDEIQDVEMQETFARLYGGRKRGSIVDHDSWFLKHNDLSNLPRRGSESFVGYDTRKVFPFGKSDSGAGSQFFDSKSLSKSAQNINDNNTKDNTEQQTDQNGNSKTHLPSEHSILLKYLK